MPLSLRRSDDADVIRQRLRRLLADTDEVGGWVPDDDLSPEAAPDRSSVPTGAPAAPDLSEDVALPAGIGRHRTPGPTARWSPERAGARALCAAGLAAALALLGWTWLDRPQVEPAPATEVRSTAPAPAQPSATTAVGEAAETSATVVVSVVGLVARPGLVTLPTGARVADAVEAAGGLLPGSDPAVINLAAVLSDGQQIAVGVAGVAGTPPVGPAGAGPGAAGGAGGLVDLNSATAAELDELPGIGPVLAERIVAHRTSSGPFRSVEELDDVPGIGPSIAADLADRVAV